MVQRETEEGKGIPGIEIQNTLVLGSESGISENGENNAASSVVQLLSCSFSLDSYLVPCGLSSSDLSRSNLFPSVVLPVYPVPFGMWKPSYKIWCSYDLP